MSSFVQLTLFVALVFAVAHAAGGPKHHEAIGHNDVGAHAEDISVAYELKSKVGGKLEILPLKVKLGAKETVDNFLPRIQALIRKHLKEIGTWAHGKHFSKGTEPPADMPKDIENALHSNVADDAGKFPTGANLDVLLSVPHANGKSVEKVKIKGTEVILTAAHAKLGEPVKIGEDGFVAHHIHLEIAPNKVNADKNANVVS